MPYASKAQQRKFHTMAARGEIDQKTVKEWDRETKKAPGGFKVLPEKVKPMKKKAFWHGFDKKASFMVPADADVAAQDVQAIPAEEPVLSPPPRPIQKFNHLGGIEPRTPEEMQIAQSVNLVTLPKDVPEGGSSCATCVHFNPNVAGSGEGSCSNPNVALPVTTRMTCSQWDSPGAHRSWDTVDMRNMGVNQMEQAAESAVDPMSEANMIDSQMAESDPSMSTSQGGQPDPNLTERGANPDQQKPVDSTPKPKKTTAKTPSTNVHVHVGSEKKAADNKGDTIARIAGLLRRNPALLKSIAKGKALVGVGAVGGHLMTRKAEVGETKQAMNFSQIVPHLGHTAEVAGLGVLATPAIQKLRGKPMSGGASAKTELAGLGILAAPSAVALGKSIKDKIPNLVRLARGHA